MDLWHGWTQSHSDRGLTLLATIACQPLHASFFQQSPLNPIAPAAAMLRSQQHWD